VGVLAAIGHYGTLALAVELGRIDAVPAALAGFLVGGVISYLLNRRWTFASDRPHGAAVPRFALVALAGFFLTGLSMAVLTDGLGLHYLPAQLVTTGLVMLWTFLANRSWTFATGARRGRGARPGQEGRPVRVEAQVGRSPLALEAGPGELRE